MQRRYRGTLYAYEQYDIQPDIVTTAKGLSNGLPIGGVLMNEKLQDTFHPGDHGTTFGGNPIACAGARVVLQRLDADFLQEVMDKGEYLKQQLLSLPHIKAVNGLGREQRWLCIAVQNLRRKKRQADFFFPQRWHVCLLVSLNRWNSHSCL